jgi:hypothetical protein
MADVLQAWDAHKRGHGRGISGLSACVAMHAQKLSGLRQGVLLGVEVLGHCSATATCTVGCICRAQGGASLRWLHKVCGSGWAVETQLPHL